MRVLHWLIRRIDVTSCLSYNKTLQGKHVHIRSYEYPHYVARFQFYQCDWMYHIYQNNCFAQAWGHWHTKIYGNFVPLVRTYMPTVSTEKHLVPAQWRHLPQQQVVSSPSACISNKRRHTITSFVGAVRMSGR